MSAPWTDAYAHADLLIIPTLGESILATIAVEISTRKHWFRKSVDDGATWSDPVLVYDAGTITLSPEPLQLLLDPITGNLKALSGYFTSGQFSLNGGASWSGN